MGHSKEDYQYHGQLLPSYLPHLRGFIKDIRSTFPHVSIPTLVELGAGSGEIVSFLADTMLLDSYAIDMSDGAFAKLSPKVTPLRTTISKAKIPHPVHAIHVKDLSVDMYKFSDLLKTIEQWVMQNTLFMFTYFIDSPDSWKTNDRAQSAGWNIIRESSWTPNPEEVYTDWYPAFPATRNIVIFQKVSSK